MSAGVGQGRHIGIALAERGGFGPDLRRTIDVAAIATQESRHGADGSKRSRQATNAGAGNEDSR